MFRKKYKHNEKSIADACGIDCRKLLRELHKMHLKIATMQESPVGSQIVEMYEKNFAKRELAFLLYWAHTIIWKLVDISGLSKEAFEMMYGIKIADKEEDFPYIM